MVFEKVKQLLVDQLGVDEDKVELSSDIAGDLGADSLDFVALAMAIEEEFGISIPDEDAKTFKTVNDVVGYIEKNT